MLLNLKNGTLINTNKILFADIEKNPVEVGVKIYFNAHSTKSALFIPCENRDAALKLLEYISQQKLITV